MGENLKISINLYIHLRIFSITVSPDVAVDAVEQTEVVEVCLLKLCLGKVLEFVEDVEEEDDSCLLGTGFLTLTSVVNLTEELDETEDLWLTEATESESASEVFLLAEFLRIPFLTVPFGKWPFEVFLTGLFLLNLFIDSVTDTSFL